MAPSGARTGDTATTQLGKTSRTKNLIIEYPGVLNPLSEVKGHGDIPLRRDRLSCMKRQFVEAALLRDGSVRDAAVLGVADNRLGEIPVALVESTSAPDTMVWVTLYERTVRGAPTATMPAAASASARSA